MAYKTEVEVGDMQIYPRADQLDVICVNPES